MVDESYPHKISQNTLKHELQGNMPMYHIAHPNTSITHVEICLAQY